VLVSSLDVQPGDTRVLKRNWGAFYGTDLDLQLRRRGIDTLVLSGIATNLGVESTARDAYERGYHQVFVEDAMSGLGAGAHEAAVGTTFPRIGQVRTSHDVLAALR
jgi:nicotinamidase-related amidase